MQLRDYFDEKCIRVSDWAKKKKIPLNWIYAAMQGRNITFFHAYKIMEATDWEVSPVDLKKSIDIGRRSSASKVLMKKKSLEENPIQV